MPLEDRCVEHACPAKVNLTLCILGKRGDGFHDLHSVVAQTSFGDRLRLEWRHDVKPGQDAVVAEEGTLPGKDNTVALALRFFREAAGFDEGAFTARLWKRIPSGAGLGGGSSDGASTLKALRDLFGDQAYGVDWAALAARIGSDCSLFLENGPVIMSGRGELVEPLPAELAARLSRLPVVLFKPWFPIPTGEAYRRLALAGLYSDEGMPDRLVGEWRAGEQAVPSPCNDFQRLLGEWMPSLAVVLDRLRTLHGLDARLSGSGSACFVFPPEGGSVISIIRDELVNAWGRDFWLETTSLN
ncbi:MAG: 4-(cytidine 5'-diphospho)-2-C-methyl-D-erythritol kinase [Oceanipulchritudo sp.]